MSVLRTTRTCSIWWGSSATARNVKNRGAGCTRLRTMIRSLLAVLAGIAVLTATSFAIEAVANPLMTRTFPELLPNKAAIQHNGFANLFLFT